MLFTPKKQHKRAFFRVCRLCALPTMLWRRHGTCLTEQGEARVSRSQVYLIMISHFICLTWWSVQGVLVKTNSTLNTQSIGIADRPNGRLGGHKPVCRRPRPAGGRNGRGPQAGIAKARCHLVAATATWSMEQDTPVIYRIYIYI